MKAIRVVGLEKQYGSNTHALRGVNLEINKGDFFCLLGLNGAGKTTLISILVGLVRPTSGQVFLMGHDLQKEPSVAKRTVGVVPQEVNMNVFHSVETVMYNHGGYYGLTRDEVKSRYRGILEEVGLAHKTKSTVQQLSGGMKRRLMLARALLINPSILILDEPTAGVDVESREAIWKLLEKRNKEGMTILLTTHYMEEAEHLCDTLAVLHKGTIIDQGPKEQLLLSGQPRQLVLHLQEDISKPYELAGIDAVLQNARTLSVTVLPDGNLSQYLQLVEKNVPIGYVSSSGSRLEQYFRLKTKESTNE